MKTKRKYHIMRIGQKILEGPRSLLPPSTVDDFGWLETEFRIILLQSPGYTQESIAIYSDNTVNRDSAYLEPLIRYVHWNRQQDISQPTRWPTVVVQLSAFMAYYEQVHEHLLTLQHLLCTLPFTPIGLQRGREAPPLAYDSQNLHLQVLFTNGVQSVKFDTLSVISQNKSIEYIMQTFLYLKSIMNPIDYGDWRERYTVNLQTLAAMNAWDWNGKALN
jgi:hypothetical protein